MFIRRKLMCVAIIAENCVLLKLQGDRYSCCPVVEMVVGEV